MQDTKERVALTSIAASGGLTIAKAVVGLFSGSLALLSEAAHSALDFVATVMTWYAVRISGKPADEEHHYGHGKVESVTALIETGLLFVLSGCGDLGSRAAAGGRRRSCGRGDRSGPSRSSSSRSSSISCARACSIARGQGDHERGARSRRAAFRLRHVVVDRGADRPWRRRARLSVGGLCGRAHRCGVHSRSRAGGSDAAPSKLSPTPRPKAPAARISRDRRHGSPAWSRSSACARARSGRRCSSISWSR